MTTRPCRRSPIHSASACGSGKSGSRVPITTSVGASLFDGRFGLAGRRPQRLTRMPAFDDDALDRAWCDGDVLLQIGADNNDTVAHALRGWPTPLGAALNASQPLFDAEGRVVDEQARFQLETVGRQVVEFAQMRRAQ